jgi:hypothetical protein
MTINNERGWKKKYSFSNWALNDSGSTEWTLNVISEEKLKIYNELIKPNYSSILDCAYYGSAVELIRGTVNDMANRYPGEIYCGTSADTGYEITIEGETYDHVCENPFNIDVWTEYIKTERVNNPLRYMCLSWSKYEVITGDAESGTPVTSWTPASFTAPRQCWNNGNKIFTGAKVNNLSFDGYFYGGSIILICTNGTNIHIRPQKKYIDELFEAFDDFEKVLLNRDTKPKYKAKFYTPQETDRGVIIYERSYIWPTHAGKWNLDFESGTYEAYLNGLLYIATYYDEYRSDNIWRSYTHESIKNFDWTTPRDTYEPEIDGHLIDTERMEAILRVGGRQFDDIKRYIENIRFTTNVSYDSKNNMQDIAMAKFLELCGWEVKNVSPVNDN